MNYKNMAQQMMGGNPYLPADTRYGGHGFQLNAVQPGPGWPMIGRGPSPMQSQGGFTIAPKGGQPVNIDPSVIQQWLQLFQQNGGPMNISNPNGYRGT